MRVSMVGHGATDGVSSSITMPLFMESSPYLDKSPVSAVVLVDNPSQTLFTSVTLNAVFGVGGSTVSLSFPVNNLNSSNVSSSISFPYLVSEPLPLVSLSLIFESVPVSGITVSTRVLFSDQLIRQGNIVDGSGVLAAANTSQLVFPSNIARQYLLIQNESSDVLWFDFGQPAIIGQPSIQLGSGAGFVMENGFVATDSVYVIGSVLGDAFTAKEG